MQPEDIACSECYRDRCNLAREMIRNNKRNSSWQQYSIKYIVANLYIFTNHLWKNEKTFQDGNDIIKHLLIETLDEQKEDEVTENYLHLVKIIENPKSHTIKYICVNIENQKIS